MPEVESLHCKELLNEQLYINKLYAKLYEVNDRISYDVVPFIQVCLTLTHL